MSSNHARLPRRLRVRWCRVDQLRHASQFANLFGSQHVRRRANRNVTQFANQSGNPAPMRRAIRVFDLPLVVRCPHLQDDRSVLRVDRCPHLQDDRSVLRVVPCRRLRAVRVRRDRARVALDTADRARERRDLQEVLADLARADRALAEHSVVRALAAVREHLAAARVVLVEGDALVADLVRVVDVGHRAAADVDVGAERTISSRR